MSNKNMLKMWLLQRKLFYKKITMQYFNFFLWFFTWIILETYIILRIKNIVKEVKTWKLNSKWIIESLLSKQIQKDLNENWGK